MTKAHLLRRTSCLSSIIPSNHGSKIISFNYYQQHSSRQQHVRKCRYFSTNDETKNNQQQQQQLLEKTDVGTTSINKLKPSNNKPSSYFQTMSELSKARLSALVVSTTSFGYLSAAPVPINYTTLACVSLGTALCSSSASTLNQIFEYDRDSKMKRTSKRPLVTQDVVGIKGATLLAATTGLSGGSILYFGTDSITAALGVGNIALYAGAYTYMKPRSEWNTWLGAVVGAVPPVMGYTAATNGFGLFDIEAALIGSTLLLWQFPHFFALAWMHRVDYARGGFEMVSTNDINGHRTAALIKNYTYYLSTLPLISTVSGITSSMFAVEGILLNGYAIYVAKNFERERSNGNARKVFLTSLWYLPCWMILFLLHSKKWKEEVEDFDTDRNSTELDLIPYLKKKAASIREKGKELCLHELYTLGDRDTNVDKDIIVDDSKNKCPVVLGKAKAKEAVAITQSTKIEATENNIQK